MKDFLFKYLPNFMTYQDEFWISIKQTLIMLFVSAAFVILIGLILGIILTVTKKDNILENSLVNKVLDIIINIFRSIPFVILITLLIPLTTFVMKTYIGVRGAIFPLIVGSIPFFVRQVEQALADVDKGVIEAAKSMGLSPFQIIYRVYLRESIPQLIRAITITLISLLGLTAMGGAVGGGGIGAFVLRYGHQRSFKDITIISVIVIILFVSILQTTGNYLARKAKH